MTPGDGMSVETVQPRGMAAVHARLPAARVPASFGVYLDQVYAAGRAGAVELDGQNIFLYRDGGKGELEIEFGVGVAAPFPAAGAVRYTELPGGRAATATHRGNYAGLGATHAALIGWCRAQGYALAGPRWEIYGHIGPDAAEPRTDVYYLLTE